MAKKEWPLCQVCGKPVSTEEGVLTMYGKELAQFKEEKAAWEKRHPFDDTGVREALNVFDFPDAVDWHWGHDRCLSEGSYEIPYSRFDTPLKALSWTLHLMEKNWIRFTNWEGAVRVHHRVPPA